MSALLANAEYVYSGYEIAAVVFSIGVVVCSLAWIITKADL